MHSGQSSRTAVAALFALALTGLCSAQAQESYRLRLGDEIRLQVTGQENLSQELTVFTRGEISYPAVGKLVFFGRTPAEIEVAVTTELAKRGMLKAEVSLLVKVVTPPGKVYIQGAVARAQEVELPIYRQLRLSQLVAICGGLADTADPRAVKLHRLDPAQPGGKQVLTIDYERVASGNDTAADLVLQDGDSIFVATRQNRSFAIAGEITRPGEFAMPPSGTTTLSRAIVRAGGFGEFANAKKVKIVREGPGGAQIIVVDANDILKDGDLTKDVQINPDDFIIVPKRLF